MGRPIKIYEPENRTVTRHSLYCCHCGNTTQWQIDLRLKHRVECVSAGLSVSLGSVQTKKILKAIERNLALMVDRSWETDTPVFRCANCQNRWIDFHERIVDSCLAGGCPGCFHCGNWMDREELIELCSECLQAHDGKIEEADCDSGYCPISDFGLGEVMQHYGTNLKELKASLGW